jgi:methyl-accepting chemotaxis protein
VESATSAVAFHVEAAQRGEISEDEAKARALASIRCLRYDGDNYFWVNDTVPAMVMHPMKPELDGKDLREYKDPGRHLPVPRNGVCLPDRRRRLRELPLGQAEAR